MALRSLFIDFNSYFASVEQQERPELRGKAVGVVPMLADTTCCIAASYEAKKFGVKTGTPVHDAKRLCKGIHLIEARHALYVEYHHRLVEAVESCIPVKRVASIDEMVCDLTGSQQQREKAVALAQHIKQTVARRVGGELRCSIGIAPNDYLAKTASDMRKPNGCVVIGDADLPHCLFALALRDLCGIGRAMEERLHHYGIRTVEQICTAGKTTLRRVWGGIEGERMYDRLRGGIVHTPPTRRSTIGHSHVLPPDLRTDGAAGAVLHKLLQKAATRLRGCDCMAGGMQVRVNYLNASHWRKQARFDHTDDTIELLKVLSTCWERRPCAPGMPYAVAVGLFNLIDSRDHTLSLFADEKPRATLNAAIDAINARYGRNMIYFGGAHAALTAAPMRIAFTHIPDPALEYEEFTG